MFLNMDLLRVLNLEFCSLHFFFFYCHDFNPQSQGCNSEHPPIMPQLLFEGVDLNMMCGIHIAFCLTFA